MGIKEGVASGAAGASTGATFGPVPAAILGALGFAWGAFGGGPEGGGGNDQLLAKLQQVQRMYENQAERNRLGRQGALANQVGLFSPMNRFLGSVGGGKAAQIDFSDVLNNPIYSQRRSMFDIPDQGTPASLPSTLPPVLNKTTPGQVVDPMMVPETDLRGVGGSGLNDPLRETGVGSLTGPPGGSGPTVPPDEPYWRPY